MTPSRSRWGWSELRRACEDVDECAEDTEFETLDDLASDTGQRAIDARFTMVRVPDDITCAQVRALEFPSQ